MIINKNSWHYRLQNAFDMKPYQSRSLCPYFWKTMACLFISSFAVFITGFVMWGIGSPSAVWLFAKVGITLGTLGSIIPGLIVGLLIFAAVAGTAFIVWYGGYRGVVAYNDRKERKEFERAKAGKHKKESLMVQFIKARKSKICPTIEFKD